MDEILIWDQEFPRSWLSKNSSKYLENLPESIPSVEWVWREMDRVWEQCGLNNRLPLKNQPIGDFYSHPVWLMNGIFTQLDPVSSDHRSAIAKYLQQVGVKNVADYGGGFGELALAITRAVSDAQVSIIEPYPSRLGIERIAGDASIRISSGLEPDCYDVAIAQDVLEHVDDPVELAWMIAGAVTSNGPTYGQVIFANCFYPVIQCHLPSTFHLRHTFRWVMRAMGLRYLGVVKDAAHAQVFERIGPLDLSKARSAERLSRVIGPVLNVTYGIFLRIKHLMLR